MTAGTWKTPMLALIGLIAIVSRGSGQTSRRAGDTTTNSPRALSGPVRVCAGGDVTLGTDLDPTWAKTNADALWQQFGLRSHPDSLMLALRPFLAGADVVLINVEGAIGSGPAPTKCGTKSTTCYAFRQPPSAARAIRSLGVWGNDSGSVVVGNVANNHSHDAGPAGRVATIAALRAAGVRVTGADTLATPLALASGDTIGVLGFYTESDSPNARDLPAVRRYVARAVARYGTVIVTMHLGAEGAIAQRTRNVNERFVNMDRGNPVAFADAAFAGGATLVVGHGPHVLRAAEWRGDRLVFYSLGNLLTYGPFNMQEPANRGAVACATIDSARSVSHAELRPTMQVWHGVLRPDSTHRAWTLIDSLSALDFPTTGATVDSTGALRKRQRP